jgi:Tol biopolymer transport system component
MRRALIIVASVAAALALVPAALAVTAKTIRVSVSSAGVQGNNSSPLYDSANSGVSRSGLIVVFSSSASNLVGRDTNGVADIFVRNRKTGKTRRLSLSSSGVQANGASYAPDISADGRYVVFVSEASNLVAGDTKYGADIFIRNRKTGKTRMLSVSSTGEQANDLSEIPSISADGDHVAFASYATNLVRGQQLKTDQLDIYVRDRSAGRTRLVSISSAGAEPNSDSYQPSISGDGNVVAFSSSATNLVGEDTNRFADVFVRVRSAHTTRRVSISSAEAQGDGNSTRPAISTNGRFVAFESNATNLAGGDSNGVPDVFVRDRALGKTRRVSISSAKAQGNAGSAWPAISANGRYVAFHSDATNLVGGDTNGSTDVFVRDRSAGTTRRMSVRFDRTQANGGSYSPEIAGSGRFVAFSSAATNLVNGDTNGFSDVFLRGPLF